MKKMIITIGRQYGSGGRVIGEALAKKFGIPCYDRELIELSSEKSGIESGVLAMHDERTSSASLFRTPERNNGVTTAGTPIVDTLFLAQSQVIREEAEKGSCVIIGRCADYVLREDPALFSVFVSAPQKNRVERIMERNRMSESDAEDAVRRVDKQRSTYYHYYTDKIWGAADSYRVTVDSSLLGIEKTVELLEDIICTCFDEAR